MSLEPLTKLDITIDRQKGPGLPPELRWLMISALRVNTTYQRPVTMSGVNTIKRIIAEFSWSRFSPIIVRRVPGKEVIYEIIDGQHRSTAALTCGYDLVPAMIVHCDDEEAARIFAAVNGTVTPMQPLSVYKAALAGNEPWAVECRDAAHAAGCEILRHPIPKNKQKPLQTMSVQAVRAVWRQHGPKVLEATFRLLTASRDSHVPGFLTNLLITRWARILGSRPGWASDLEQVRQAVNLLALNLAFEDPAHAEHKIEQYLGDGRKGDALVDIKAKVAEAMGRRLSPQMIATSLRLPYAVVDKLIAEIRGEKLLLDAPR